MTQDNQAGEAARRIEKAFTTGGAYSGDDPVTVARAYLSSSKRIKELEKALAVTVDDFEAAAEALETSDPAMANACRRAALENLSIADATMSALKGE